MNQLVINISGPEVAEAVGRFMPDLAKAMVAEQARYDARYPHGILTAGPCIGATEAGSSPFVDVGDGTVMVHPDAKVTVSTFGEAKGPEKKSRAKKVAEPEPVKAEAEETCLDVKPSAEAQQELPLKTAAEIGYEPAAPELTIDDLRRHLRTYGQANGAEALSALYAEYGAKQLSDLPAEKYADIIAKVSA